jgi:hypothetical protein
MDLNEKGLFARQVACAVRRVSVLRWFGHVCTPGTMVLAIKDSPG